MTSRRALVSLPEGVWKIIDSELKGKIGDGSSEVIRNIVIAYLTERGYLLKPQTQQPEDIVTELDIHDSMIESLVDMLEEKGLINTDEWDRKTQKKLNQNTRE
jgi:metal-responsive CopG/Arc/MetJ family transcriptional regulator